MNAPPKDAAIRARLERSIGPVCASDLRAHLARDGVFYVAQGLSLLDCAVAIALDDADAVRGWLAAGALRRPTPDEKRAWPALESRHWMAVVVQPFVLVQDIAAENA